MFFGGSAVTLASRCCALAIEQIFAPNLFKVVVNVKTLRLPHILKFVAVAINGMLSVKTAFAPSNTLL